MSVITGKDIYQDDGTLQALRDNLRYISEEAKKIKVELGATNTTFSKGREKVNELNEEIEKLLAQYKEQKITVDQLEKSLEKEIQKTIEEKTAKQALNTVNRETNTIAKLTAQLNSSAEGSYNKLSAQYSLNKIALNKLSQEQRKTTAEGKKLEAETKAIYEEMKLLQEATGKHVLNVGNYKDALEGLPGPLGRLSTGLSGANSMFLKLVKNPVVATLAVIAGLFTALVSSMKRSEDGQDRLNKALLIGKTVWDNVLDVVLEFGIALWDTLPKFIKRVKNDFTVFGLDIESVFLKMRIAWNNFTGDSKESKDLNTRLSEIKSKTKDLKDESERLGNETVKAFSSGANKVKDFGKEMAVEIERAKKLADIEAQMNKTERKYMVENAQLANESASLRAKAEELKKTDAEAGLKLLEKAFTLDEKILQNEIALEKTRSYLLIAKSDLAEDTIQDKKDIAQAEANIYQKETEYDEKRRERLRSMNKYRMEAFRQETDRRKIEIDTLKELNDIEIRGFQRIIDLESSTQEQRNQAAEQINSIRIKQAKDTSQIEVETLNKEYELKLISDVDYAAKKKSIEAKLTNELAKLNEDLFQTKKEIIQSTYESDMESFARKQEIAKLEFENTKRTEIEKNKFELQQQIELLKKELQLRIKYGQYINNEELDLIKAKIKNAEIELGNIKPKKGIFELLGFSFNDEQKQLIADAFRQSTQFITDYFNKQKEIADELLSLRQKETDQTLTKLQIERDAQAAGYHNNVAQAEKDYKLAQKKQNDAIALQKKAQREQIAINAALQASNMVTGTAKIWSTFASQPYIAIPLIAIMWGSFIASQAKALSLTKKYKKGGYELIQGGSHWNNNDTYIGSNNKTDNYAESGEGMAVFNRGAVSKYGKMIPDLVEMLNTGKYTIPEKRQRQSQVQMQNVIVKNEKPNMFMIPVGEKMALIDEKGIVKKYITLAN